MNDQDYIDMRIDEAKAYINYGIKEGYFDESLFENMTNEEMIKFADDNIDAEIEAMYEDALEAESTGN